MVTARLLAAIATGAQSSADVSSCCLATLNARCEVPRPSVDTLVNRDMLRYRKDSEIFRTIVRAVLVGVVDMFPASKWSLNHPFRNDSMLRSLSSIITQNNSVPMPVDVTISPVVRALAFQRTVTGGDCSARNNRERLTATFTRYRNAVPPRLMVTRRGTVVAVSGADRMLPGQERDSALNTSTRDGTLGGCHGLDLLYRSRKYIEPGTVTAVARHFSRQLYHHSLVALGGTGERSCGSRCNENPAQDL